MNCVRNRFEDFGTSADFFVSVDSSAGNYESISSILFKEDLNNLGRELGVIVQEEVGVIEEAVIENVHDEEGVIEIIPLQVSSVEAKEIDMTDILETTPLRVYSSPHNNAPLLV
ncbi:unnamed protein product, partial [Cuscuta epithymum]